MSRTPPRSIGSRKGLSRAEIAEGIRLIDYWGQGRPKVRSECGEQRPCPFVSCRYNLYLDVKNRRLRLNFPHLTPEQMPWSCALDEAAEYPDGMTLEEIGVRMNITRERVRQLEGQFLVKVRELAPDSLALQQMIDAWETRRETDQGGDVFKLGPLSP